MQSPSIGYALLECIECSINAFSYRSFCPMTLFLLFTIEHNLLFFVVSYSVRAFENDIISRHNLFFKNDLH